jgi:hypothetical protein
LSGEPWCSNWKEVALNDKVQPNFVRSEFKGNIQAYLTKKKVNAHTTINAPLSAFNVMDDVQMVNIIEEEKSEAV